MDGKQLVQWLVTALFGLVLAGGAAWVRSVEKAQDRIEARMDGEILGAKEEHGAIRLQMNNNTARITAVEQENKNVQKALDRIEESLRHVNEKLDRRTR